LRKRLLEKKNTVCPELVEGLSYSGAQEQEQGFDKLSPNGFGK